MRRSTAGSAAAGICRLGARLPVGLLVLGAACVAAYVGPLDYVVVLQYDTPSSFFVFSVPFLTQWLDHPGGALLYAGRFLRQFFHYPGLGAATVALLVVGCGALLQGLRRRLASRVGPFHTFAPCLFLAVLHSASTMTLGLLVVAGAFLSYRLLPAGRGRRAGALATVPVLYLAAGGFVWVYVVWVLADQWLEDPRGARRFTPLLAAAAVALPWAAYRWFFPISPWAAWLSPFSLPSTWLERLFVAYVAGVPVWPRVPWDRRLDRLAAMRSRIAVEVVLLAGLGAVLLWAGFDARARELAGYHRLYRSGQWDAILQRAGRRPPADALLQFLVNHALARKGTLLEEMLRFPQAWGTRGLVLGLANTAEYGRLAMYNSDLYYQLGHANAAYRLAYNQTTLTGETYANLRRIAECAMVNGSDETATKCLLILERTLFHRGWAREQLRLIRDPAAEDRVLAQRRRLLPTVELDVGLGEYADLLTLVESNPRNRLAFDYLMAWCLLDKTLLEVVADHAPGFTLAGYRSLPRHVQEALMVWQSATGQPLDRRVVAYEPASMQRFEQFGQRLDRFAGQAEAERGLKAGFGDTYMYYFVLATTPLEGTPVSSWLRLANELYARGRGREADLYYRQAAMKQPESVRAGVSLADLAQAGSDSAGEGGDRSLPLRSHY